MLINTVEVNAESELLAFIEEINKAQTLAWSVLLIKKECLKEISNNAFILAVKSKLLDATRAEVFFLDQLVCIAWLGMPAQIRRNLRELITTSLLRENVSENIDEIITYYDPQVMGNELSIAIKARLKNTSAQPIKAAAVETKPHRTLVLESSPKRIENFKRLQSKRTLREKLHILIVEDQAFTRKLLYDVLKNTYEVASAESVERGWQLYLETVPNIVFLDIELTDASGHLLAAKIKEIDPASFVIMVTANNSVEDVQVAKQNKVAGFIAKPFSKQKINEAIEKYKASKGAR